MEIDPVVALAFASGVMIVMLNIALVMFASLFSLLVTAMFDTIIGSTS